jgi:hypothetical protein
VRRTNDFYETAPWQVDALVDHLPELMSGLVLCPCVGDGSLMRQLERRVPALTFITNDLDPAKEADFHLDMTKADSWACIVRAVGAPPEWVVENFPFNLEAQMLPYALDAARYGVVAMARVSFCEPTKDRGPWLSENPYQKRITLERHSFTANGKTDSATTDWLVWANVPIAGPFGISAYGYREGRWKANARPAALVDEIMERTS